jgi:predicted enzyme related to lactoylglutathione lyase
MTTTGRLELVALDAADIDSLSDFYARLNGWEIVRKDSDWITIRTPDGQEVAFQVAPDHVPPHWPGRSTPQQVQLDLLIDGHEAAAERAVALGATRLADGSSWITLAEPAGHPFDLCQRNGVGLVMRLFAVTINSPRWPSPAHPQQAHLDILVDDLDTGEARALGLGASRLDGGGTSFRVFADPVGHPFCLTV